MSRRHSSRPRTDCPFRSGPCTRTCRSGALGSAHLPTFCARVRYAEARRRSADMAGPAQAEPDVRWSADRRFRARTRPTCGVVRCGCGGANFGVPLTARTDVVRSIPWLLAALYETPRGRIIAADATD